MTKLKIIWMVMIFLWVATPQYLAAQTSNLNALNERLQRTTSPYEKMQIYFQLSEINVARKPSVAAYQAGQALNLAKSLRNKPYIRNCNILLGKTFIKQGDEANAKKYLKIGQDLAKADNDPRSYLDAATILSGIEIQKNNYKKAYEINLMAINFINRNKGNFSKLNSKVLDSGANVGSSGGATSNAKTQKELEKWKAANLELQEEVAILNEELVRLNGEIVELQLDNQEGDISDTPKTNIVYVDTSATDTSRTPVVVYVNEEDSPRMSLFRYLTIGLGILALVFLIGLIWLWNKYQKSQNYFDDKLTKKDRLIRNYKEEIEEQDQLRNLSILGGKASAKSINVNPFSILAVDLDDSVKGMLKLDDKVFASEYDTLMKDIRLITSQHSDIFYIKKMGSKLFFGTGISKFKHNPDQLLNLAKELSEYFKDNKALGNKAKIAVHSGPVVLSASDVNTEQLDILGTTFDQCEWLVNHTQGGQILVSNETRVLTTSTAGLEFIKSQTDTTGQTIELYELN